MPKMPQGQTHGRDMKTPEERLQERGWMVSDGMWVHRDWPDRRLSTKDALDTLPVAPLLEEMAKLQGEFEDALNKWSDTLSAYGRVTRQRREAWDRIKELDGPSSDLVMLQVITNTRAITDLLERVKRLESRK